MIVGNVEDYIERCLRSFAPFVDEICIVRAIGNLAPDRTIDIVEKMFPDFRFAEYRNAPEHSEWLHVDNFAAARQMSFDLATGDYCLWCDSDDVLKSGGDLIRRHAAEASYACYIFPYDIFGKNTVVDRERLIAKGSGHWEYPVHECFKFKVEPVQAAVDDGVVIQHLPRLDKGDREIARGGATGNQRNLRILESIDPEKMTVGLKYHLFGELMCANRKTEAVRLAVELITSTDLGKDERYDLLMSLVLQSPDIERQVDLLHEAHKTDPLRREALGVLSCVMMDMGKPASALAYARQMIATRPPDVHSWNSRLHFYGYTGDDIYQQALRVNGRMADAELVRIESLSRHGGPRIALLHATRGRPEKASRCRKAWHDLASKPGQVEHIFAFDADDAESAILKRYNHVVLPAGGGCVAAWNAAAFRTTAPILVQLSDDWMPVAHWDDLICDRIGDATAERVLAISDGHRTDSLLCMAICTRNYLCMDFFMFHPFFFGVYSDNWFTEQAYARGAVIEARDIVFNHSHPAFCAAPMDATYQRQNDPARYEHGEKIIAMLRAGTDWSSVPGFFNYWEFYAGVAAQLKDGDVVAEVGVWLGRSIIFMAQLLKRSGKKVKLLAVDTFRGEENQPAHEETVREHGGSLLAAFKENIRRCGVEDMIEIVQGDSASSAAPIDAAALAFVFIDAAHDYQSVKRDIAAWQSKVKKGGMMAGHDIQHDEVKRAVTEMIPDAVIHLPVWYKAIV